MKTPGVQTAREKLRSIETEGKTLKEIADECGVSYQRIHGIQHPYKTNPNIPPSTRQVEVLRLIASGKENHEIADAMSLSVKTVEKHRQAMYRRLGAHNVAQALIEGIRRGLIKV